MFDDESKQQKNLWKNLKTEKNKYVKEDESHHSPRGRIIAHSLDDAI